MKILITGSRKWTDHKAIEKAILGQGCVDPIIIHGAAHGADLIAEALAKKHQWRYRGYPAKWKQLGTRAGSIRNIQMLDEEHCAVDPIHVCLAFPLPDSVGTLHMIGLCRQEHIQVIRSDDR